MEMMLHWRQRQGSPCTKQLLFNQIIGGRSGRNEILNRKKMVAGYRTLKFTSILKLLNVIQKFQFIEQIFYDIVREVHQLLLTQFRS